MNNAVPAKPEPSDMADPEGDETNSLLIRIFRQFDVPDGTALSHGLARTLIKQGISQGYRAGLGAAV